jgi:hypothetical protein
MYMIKLTAVKVFLPLCLTQAYVSLGVLYA